MVYACMPLGSRFQAKRAGGKTWAVERSSWPMLDNMVNVCHELNLNAALKRDL